MDAGPFVLRWACHADTDVNIDYRESDLAILALVGRVAVLPPVLDEVPEIDGNCGGIGQSLRASTRSRSRSRSSRVMNWPCCNRTFPLLRLDTILRSVSRRLDSSDGGGAGWVRALNAERAA